MRYRFIILQVLLLGVVLPLTAQEAKMAKAYPKNNYWEKVTPARPTPFQETGKKEKKTKVETEKTKKNSSPSLPTLKNGVSVGFNFGTKALAGLDVLVKTDRRFGFRFGFNYLDITVRDYATDFNKYSKEVNFAGSMYMSSVEGQGMVSLWNDNLRLVTGLNFNDRNGFDLSVKLDDSLAVNDVVLSPDELGYVQGYISWKRKVSPYVGVSVGKSIPRKRWNANFDAGIYLKGKPTFRMNATNLLRSNERNEELIEDKLSFVTWYPVLNFRLGYRIF
jgi:hypothetical protein